jgi:hypothetical protein
VGQPLQPELGKAVQGADIRLIACREQQDHGLRIEPSRHEGQCLCRRLIEPLRIIDDAEKWS